jgi:lipase ATG15
MRSVLVQDSHGAESSLLVYDVYPENGVYVGNDQERPELVAPLRIRSRSARIYRFADPWSMFFDKTPETSGNPRRETGALSHDWQLDTVSEPDVSDKETVLGLAKMSSDAYLFNELAPHWFNSTAGFNLSSSFGWQDNMLRGHVFANENNSTVVIAIKGTSGGQSSICTNFYLVDADSSQRLVTIPLLVTS